MVPHKLHVLYEDNHLLIVNKPGGLLVQGDSTGDETLLDIGKKYIKEKYNKPGNVFLGVVHADDEHAADWLVDKVCSLRIFPGTGADGRTARTGAGRSGKSGGSDQGVIRQLATQRRAFSTQLFGPALRPSFWGEAT